MGRCSWPNGQEFWSSRSVRPDSFYCSCSPVGWPGNTSHVAAANQFLGPVRKRDRVVKRGEQGDRAASLRARTGSSGGNPGLIASPVIGGDLLLLLTHGGCARRWLRCPLSGVKRTCRLGPGMSTIDTQLGRTFSCPLHRICCWVRRSICVECRFVQPLNS
jgi:hypothetical protein